MDQIDCTYCSGSARVKVSSYQFAECPICDGKGKINAPPKDERSPCRYCMATGRIKISSYMVEPCSKCGGLGFIHEPKPVIKKTLAVTHLKGDKPYSDRRDLEEILQDLEGEVRICETYLSEESLDLLGSIPNSCKISALVGPRTNLAKLKVKLDLFRKEFPNSEFRQYSSSGLHDRYIIDDNSLMILGYGLQRVGIGGESFVIILNNEWIEDMKAGVITEFDKKWNDPKTKIP